VTAQTGPARQGPTERCTCGHTKRDHSGRRDHREKYGPTVAGRPWCHACETECIYCPPDPNEQALTGRQVELRVIAKLEADFDKHQHLLAGRELSRRREGDHIILTWIAPDAPPGAAVMSPWFTLVGDRIELGGIDYYDTAGYRIT